MYQKVLRPLFFKFDAETVHHLAMTALQTPFFASLMAGGKQAPYQPVKLWDLEFRNPLGLAAGFDKDALALDAWEKLGFGFVEVGTVTPKAQPGNPLPRIFRCPAQQGLVNRMGFPNAGAQAMRERLQKQKRTASFPIGINIGKAKTTDLEHAVDDYAECFTTLYDQGDFFVINVSSPNTPGLRALQQPEMLRPIFERLQNLNRGKPLLVKIAPDLDLEEIAQIVKVAEECQLSGIVATNTTLDHSSITLQETGGLSGLPLKDKSNHILRFIRERTHLPIIGVGGVFTRQDYLEKLKAGANLVQLYTGFVYEGPQVCFKIL